MVCICTVSSAIAFLALIPWTAKQQGTTSFRSLLWTRIIGLLDGTYTASIFCYVALAPLHNQPLDGTYTVCITLHMGLSPLLMTLASPFKVLRYSPSTIVVLLSAYRQNDWCALTYIYIYKIFNSDSLSPPVKIRPKFDQESSWWILSHWKR